VTELVSVSLSGGPGHGASFGESICPTAGSSAFSSIAKRPRARRHDLRRCVFVRDRATGVTERVSLDSRGQEFTRGR